MSVATNFFGLILFVVMLSLLVVVSWWQWNSYVTLDQRIDQCDETLLHSSSTKVETILDAPEGSVIVPYVPAQAVPIQQPPPF